MPVAVRKNEGALEGLQTLTELVARRVRDAPDRVAYSFIERSGGVEILTRQQLSDAATAVAARLQQQGLTGQQALLTCTSARNFVIAFIGCLMAGVVAVPAPPVPSRRFIDRIQLIATDARARVVICDTAAGGLIGAATGLETLDMSLPISTAFEGSNLAVPASLGPSSVAFLQYTSGSTSDPKGVVVTHRNVLANAELLARSLGYNERSRMLTQLPLFHDMGLMLGVLEPLYAGCEGVFMEPAQVLLRPGSWLKTISQLGITHSAAPNFMYRLASELDSRETDGLDLSTWKFAICGSEPVRRVTVDQFLARFSRHGFGAGCFYPCYGLAEATLIVSGGIGWAYASAEGLPASASVPCGNPQAEVKLLLVDPVSHLPVRDGCVGEVWIKGDTVAAGYWCKPTLSNDIFHAYTRDTGEGPFLRTGDLGVLKDGQLHITGRMKDVIIVNGRKVALQDVEQEVELSDPGIKFCAAFSYDDGTEERLGITVEVERSALRNSEEIHALKARVATAVFDVHRVVPAHIDLLPPFSAPRTTSGKAQRSLARAEFLSRLGVTAPSSIPTHHPVTDAMPLDGGSPQMSFP